MSRHNSAFCPYQFPMTTKTTNHTKVNNDDGHNNDEANRQQPDVAEELNALQSAISRISRKVSTNQVYLREIGHRISQLERATQRLTETMQRWEDQQQPRQQQHAPHADQNRRRRNSPPSLDNRRNQATNTCAFCGDEHWATDCTQYRTLSQRRAQCYNRNRKLAEAANKNEEELNQFENFWNNIRGTTLITTAATMTRQLEKRLIELRCHKIAMQHYARTLQSTSTHHPMRYTPYPTFAQEPYLNAQQHHQVSPHSREVLIQSQHTSN
ncbi:hypothetical protein OSTOST_00046 [Ostertagia ostertagi]